MTFDEFVELSAGHALHALSPADESAYLEALAEHPEWAAIAASDDATATALADSVTEVAPPADIRARLLAQIAPAEPAPTPTEPPAATPTEPPASTEMMQTVQRRNWTRAIFGLAASMVLLVGIGWGVGALSDQWQTPPDVRALEQIEAAPDASSASAQLDSGAMATVHWSESVGSVVLVMQDLTALPADQTYELWYVRGDTPVSAGTFAAEGQTTTAQLDGPMQPGDTVAVTVEPAGGAPDGVPTSTPIVAIPTA